MSHSRPRRKRKPHSTQAKPLVKVAEKPQTNSETQKPIPFTRSVSASYSEQYSGPLIHPRIIEQWEQLHPGAAKIVIEEFQAQGKHRRDLEAKVIQSDINRSNWGLASGLIVSLSAMGICVFAIANNQPWVAGVVGGGTIATLAGVFVYGSQMRRSEREEKAKQNR